MKFFIIAFVLTLTMSVSHAQYGDDQGGEQGGQGGKGAYGKAVSKQLDENVTSTCRNINAIRTARGLKAIPCGNRLGGKKQQGQDDGSGGDDGYGNY